MRWLGEPIKQPPLELLDDGIAERDNKESDRADTEQPIEEEDGLTSRCLGTKVSISYRRITSTLTRFFRTNVSHEVVG